jgi:1,4-dihydroxy-2-naphthoyl-CoA hydrolase
MTVPTGVAGMQALAALPEPKDQAAVLDIIRGMGGELATTMGIDVTEFTLERVVATMPVAGNRQPFDLLHGGANAVLAETLGSLHAALVGDGKAALGIELNCSHHRAARDGLVTGVSIPLHVGRTLATFQIVISDDAGRRVCTARLSCVLREQPG